MELKHVDQAINLYDGNNLIGEIKYQYYDANTIDVYKTVVDKKYRGQGLAQVLLKELMKYVETNNLLVIPNCSYVYAVFMKNPDYQKYQHPTIDALPSCQL